MIFLGSMVVFILSGLVYSWLCNQPRTIKRLERAHDALMFMLISAGMVVTAMCIGLSHKPLPADTFFIWIIHTFP